MAVMAEETCSARFLRRVAECALRLRQPAKHSAGSVRAAVVVAAIFVGAYNLVIGSVYLSENRRFVWGMSGMVTTAGFVAFIAAVADFSLIFGVIRRKDEYIHTIVSAALAAYLLCAPTSLSVILGLTYNTRWVFQLWEVPRILMYPLYMCLLYCLLVELRDSASEPDNGGWLKSNMASQEPSALGDGLLLKVEKTSPAPATFAPSICVTAAPVHAALRGAAPVPASGPLSSSEA